MTERKRYLVATQQPWGMRVYDLVSRDDRVSLWVARQADPSEPDRYPLLQLCEETDPRYVFFVHWSTRVPPEVYDHWECVNFHCTELPYGRGGHPIENLLLRGHAETVMTAHRVVEELDAGPIYARQYRVPLDGRTKAEILDGFVGPVAWLLARIVATEMPAYPQDDRGVVRFSRLSREAYDDFWCRRSELVV